MAAYPAVLISLGSGSNRSRGALGEPPTGVEPASDLATSKPLYPLSYGGTEQTEWGIQGQQPLNALASFSGRWVAHPRSPFSSDWTTKVISCAFWAGWLRQSPCRKQAGLLPLLWQLLASQSRAESSHVKRRRLLPCEPNPPEGLAS